MRRTSGLSASLKIITVLFLLGVWAVPAPPATFTTCIDFLPSARHIFGPSGGSASVPVEAAESCDWSAMSNPEWIRLTSNTSGSGSGSVSYSVAVNPNPSARTGTLSIAGWTFTVTQAGANESLFEDDMENGTDGWGGNTLPLGSQSVLTTGGWGSAPPSPWAQTTMTSRSGTHAWTDSPGGNYQNDLNVGLMSPVIDLTGVDSATLTFWHRFDFANSDAGNVWVLQRGQLRNLWSVLIMKLTFTGTRTTWQQALIDLSPFVGGSIRLGFQLLSDSTNTADGWYIDDMAVFSTDFSAPAPDPDLCRDYGPCGVGQGDCDPGQCGAGLICAIDVGPQYGLPALYDVCELPEGSSTPDPHLCRDYGPCGVGQGDCDPGQCGARLVCAADVGPQYGLPALYDVCEVPSGDITQAPDPHYCRDYGPCSAGQGDCDPGQCAAGLFCAADVGPQYGLPAIYDVCEAPSD